MRLMWVWLCARTCTGPDMSGRAKNHLSEPPSPEASPAPRPHPYNHKVVEAFYLFANHSLTEHVFAQEDMAVNLTDNAP